ncbi:glutamate--tRNA ligase [Candidatus Collierbacteria bacterium]|nr:glutamate--tRNA ligase [Candidatus Collierbacteria bacterium]
MNKPPVRTRYAPSPTGTPHIGNTRTALFAYLLAKKNKGQFILRLEDTDPKRTIAGSAEKIYAIQEFLGLTPDESPLKGGPFTPYVQTERLEIYKQYAKQLIDQQAAYEDQGAIRIRMPKEGFTSWVDLVQGKISIPNKEVDDKVLLKSDGLPTYHLAAMVDDHLMGVTHIIRGVEYIVSTPVHLKIYQALGWQFPQIAHVPLLLGPDKTKLSKRHGAKSVLEYKNEGYLPEAINNFLFYLGFSYKDNSELLTLEQMAEIFDENRIQKQNAIFDIAKLNFFNSRWIRFLSDEELLRRLEPFIPDNWRQKAEEKFPLIVPLIKDRLITLNDITTLADFFFTFTPPSSTDLLNQSQMSLEMTKAWLNQVHAYLESADDFQSEPLHQGLRAFQEASGLSARQAFMTLRLAVTGRTVTPPLFDVLVVLGKKESLSRLNQATEIL